MIDKDEVQRMADAAMLRFKQLSYPHNQRARHRLAVEHKGLELMTNIIRAIKAGDRLEF